MSTILKPCLRIQHILMSHRIESVRKKVQELIQWRLKYLFEITWRKISNLQETRLYDRSVKQGPVNNSDEKGNRRHHILERGTQSKSRHKNCPKDHLKTP